MEKLKYIIEDSTIAELLGVQNFSTDEAAVLELVKNAYDANALQVTLKFERDTLSVVDNGDGMNVDDIKKYWMHIGQSGKIYSSVDKNGRLRVQSGAKGVGRFALARLGESVCLYSRKDGEEGLLWETDWNTTTLLPNKNVEKVGTTIVIKNLREKWNEKRVRNLIKFLGRTYNDTSMEVEIVFNGVSSFLDLHFPKAIPGTNCRSKIELKYSSGYLLVTVTSDEFSEEAKLYCGDVNLSRYVCGIDVVRELEGNKLYDYTSEEDVEKRVKELGDFSAVFLFNLVATKLDQEKFLYKYLKTVEKVEGGIVLYRNAFSISSYEGEKDWLGLGKRSRKSPAAASHPTGAWRVRENQLSGQVLIDKVENKVLRDLMNRQGLDENQYYQLFIQIILIGIGAFERYRQNIIRKINKKNIDIALEPVEVMDKIIKNPQLVYSIDNEDLSSLVNEIKQIKLTGKTYEQDRASAEARYKYDVRILNVLATIGLKASSIAHEMKTDRNTLNDNYSSIIQALKEYELWDILNQPQNTSNYYKNVPSLLKRMDDVGRKVVSFMDTMLYAIEKKHFEASVSSINGILESVKNSWERDYSFLEFKIEIEGEVKYLISEDIIRVIFDNLILNSVQQNESIHQLTISIKSFLQNEKLIFVYSDNGSGLSVKYKDNPYRILEVHETTRTDGHGLGMWIVNNSIVMTGGEVLKIEGDQGFLIEFALGGEGK